MNKAHKHKAWLSNYSLKLNPKSTKPKIKTKLENDHLMVLKKIFWPKSFTKKKMMLTNISLIAKKRKIIKLHHLFNRSKKKE